MLSRNRYDLVLMSESEFIESVCTECIFEGCCCPLVYNDCTNALRNRYA